MSQMMASNLLCCCDPQPPKLYVLGEFTHAGGRRVNGAAMFDGTHWAAAGGLGFGHVSVCRMLISSEEIINGAPTGRLYKGQRKLYAIMSPPGTASIQLYEWDMNPASDWQQITVPDSSARKNVCIGPDTSGSGVALYVLGAQTIQIDPPGGPFKNFFRVWKRDADNNWSVILKQEDDLDAEEVFEGSTLYNAASEHMGFFELGGLPAQLHIFFSDVIDDEDPATWKNGPHRFDGTNWIQLGRGFRGLGQTDGPSGPTLPFVTVFRDETFDAGNPGDNQILDTPVLVVSGGLAAIAHADNIPGKGEVVWNAAGGLLCYSPGVYEPNQDPFDPPPLKDFGYPLARVTGPPGAFPGLATGPSVVFPVTVLHLHTNKDFLDGIRPLHEIYQSNGFAYGADPTQHMVERQRWAHAENVLDSYAWQLSGNTVSALVQRTMWVQVSGEDSILNDMISTDDYFGEPSPAIFGAQRMNEAGAAGSGMFNIFVYRMSDDVWQPTDGRVEREWNDSIDDYADPPQADRTKVVLSGEKWDDNLDQMNFPPWAKDGLLVLLDSEGNVKQDGEGKDLAWHIAQFNGGVEFPDPHVIWIEHPAGEHPEFRDERFKIIRGFRVFKLIDAENNQAGLHRVDESDNPLADLASPWQMVYF